MIEGVAGRGTDQLDSLLLEILEHPVHGQVRPALAADEAREDVRGHLAVGNPRGRHRRGGEVLAAALLPDQHSHHHLRRDVAQLLTDLGGRS